MTKKNKNILFYNVIPMPHSLLLQSKLEEKNFVVHFWYYKNKKITDLYPWKELITQSKFNVFYGHLEDYVKLLDNFLKSELIVVSGFHTIIHLIISFLAIFSKKRLAIWCDVPKFKNISLSNFHKELIKRFVFYFADFIFVTGKTGCKLFKEKRRISKYKIVDFPYLGHSFSEKEVIFKAIKHNQKIKIFVSNRFEERKGYKILYQAICLLDKNVLDKFTIKIAGVGSEFSFYKEKFDKLGCDISFLGWISYENYVSEIINTDILIHASIREPFGIPPIDAMACGKLVIGSNGVYSCLDRIENGYNGFIYDKNNPNMLAKILEKIAIEPILIQQLGQNAYFTSLKFTADYNIYAVNRILKNK